MSKENYDIFFSSPGRSAKKDANDICSKCPVFEDCLSHALKYEDYGYWAGTSPKDRQKMRVDLGIKLENISLLSLLAVSEEAQKHEEFVQSQKMKRGPKGPRKKKE